VGRRGRGQTTPRELVGEKEKRHNDQDAERGDGGGVVAPRLAMRPDGQTSNQRDENEKPQDEKSAHCRLPQIAKKDCQQKSANKPIRFAWRGVGDKEYLTGKPASAPDRNGQRLRISALNTGRNCER
jgi:hypothetical protein